MPMSLDLCALTHSPRTVPIYHRSPCFNNIATKFSFLNYKYDSDNVVEMLIMFSYVFLGFDY